MDSEDFDAEYSRYLESIGELQHKPIDGPRGGHAGENIFSYAWAMKMETERKERDPPNWPLVQILWNLDMRITQRHANVAASFITWLGTNSGNCIIQRARSLYDTSRHTNLEDCFVAAWSIENMRRIGTNRGTRVIESMLAPGDHFGPDLFGGSYGLRRVPDLSVEDFETVDHVAHWCGSTEGCAFIRRCESLITMRERYTTADTIKVIAGVAS